MCIRDRSNTTFNKDRLFSDELVKIEICREKRRESGNILKKQRICDTRHNNDWGKNEKDNIL